MKKLFSLTIIFLLGLLVGCSNANPADIASNDVVLTKNQSLVFSTYLASSLLGSSTTQNMVNTNDYNVKFLTDTTDSEELAIESELDDVNVYFDKLKVFMDGGVDSLLTVTEQASTNPNYDYEITYTIDGVTYTIYYSYVTAAPQDTVDTVTTATVTNMSNDSDDEIDDDENNTNDEVDDEENDIEDEADDEEVDEAEEFTINGLMTINGVDYQLVGENKYEGTEQKMYFETIDTQNTGNSVRVEIKNEDETQKFAITTVLNGVETKSQVKFTNEENETKVDLKLINGTEQSTYSFKKVVEDGVTVYKLQYEVNGVNGEVRITEVTDENGNVTYKYDVREDGRSKEIEKDDHDDDDDTEEDVA